MESSNYGTEILSTVACTIGASTCTLSDNLAAHPDMQAESITRDDAEDLQVFVYAITEYVYDLAERYEEFKERQARRAKAKGNRKGEAGFS